MTCAASIDLIASIGGTMTIIDVFIILFVICICFTPTGKAASARTPLLLNQLNITAITWNLAEKLPTINDCRFLYELGNEKTDILILGVQECEDIRPRRREGHRSRGWRAIQHQIIENLLNYRPIANHRMGGIQLAVYAKKHIADNIEGYQVMDVACGIGNVLTNKGAICVLLRYQNQTIGIINSHLAAHQHKINERNQDYHRIMNEIIVKSQTKWLIEPYQREKRRRKKLAAGASHTQVPWIGQVFTAVGIGGTTDVTTAVTSEREYSFQRLSEDGYDQLRALRAPKVLSLTQRKGVKRSLYVGLENRRVDKKKEAASKSKKIRSTESTVKLPPSPFDALIFLGDLNYRVDYPRLEIEAFKEKHFPSSSKRLFKESSKSEKRPKMKKGEESDDDRELLARLQSPTPRLDLPTDASAARARLLQLLRHDQLKKQIYLGRAFRGFKEGDIGFMPSFKYDKGSDRLDSSGKFRPPAWTDRILFASNQPAFADKFHVLEYSCFDCRHSDHRPVFARLSIDLDKTN